MNIHAQSATVLPLALTCFALHAAPSLSVVGYELAAQKRLSSTVYQYTYRIQVRNAGTAASSVEVDLLSVPPGVLAVQRATGFASIAGGATATSGADIVVQHDRSKPFQFGMLGWSVRGQDGTFTGRLPGNPAAPAVSATQNYHTSDVPSHVATDGAGRELELRELDIEFAPDATIGQVNAALDIVGAKISAMRAGRTSFALALPDPGTPAGLDLVFGTLRRMPGVQGVWPAVVAQPFALPPNADYANPTAPAFYEPSASAIARSAYLQNHLATRAHGTWNLAGLLATERLRNMGPILIYSDQFSPTPPGWEFDATTNSWRRTASGLWAGEFNDRDFLPTFKDLTHGYAVASVAGASFGGDFTDGKREAGLVSGLFPALLYTRVLQATGGSFRHESQAIDLLAALTTEAGPGSKNVIFNTSYGACPSTGPCDDWHRTMAVYAAGRYLQAVNDRLLGTDGQPSFLHVYAVGNEPSRWAYTDRFGSGDAALALQDPTVDPYVARFHQPGKLAKLAAKVTATSYSTLTLDNLEVAQDGNGNPVFLDKRSHLVGVEAKLSAPTQQVTFPGDPALDLPPSTRQIAPFTLCPAAASTRRGSIGGIGYNNDPAGLAGGVWTINGAAGPADDIGGTSYAAPQVTAAAAWIWSLAPELNVADVRRLLMATAVPSSGANCTDGPDYASGVDSYAAALSTDNPYPPSSPQYKDLGNTATAPARQWLLDVASVDGAGNLVGNVRDGRFTQADLMWFLREFDKRHGDQTPDYSRYDLNGNGVTGEPGGRQDVIHYSRFDLDGNLSWTFADKTVEGVAQRFREDITNDLAVLIYYAYSPLYTGNQYERTMLLLPYLNKVAAPAGLFLGSLFINVPPPNPRSTQFQIGDITELGAAFTSLCSAERGVPLYSAQVQAQAQALDPGVKLVFWRPTSQFGRLVERPPNQTNCSSFVAAAPGLGRMWVNSAARYVDPVTGADEEYQSRFDFGEPDLAAGPGTTFTPPARRLATQRLTYGIVPAPTAAFGPAFSTQAFFASAPGFVPGAALAGPAAPKAAFARGSAKSPAVTATATASVRSRAARPSLQSR